MLVSNPYNRKAHKMKYSSAHARANIREILGSPRIPDQITGSFPLVQNIYEWTGDRFDESVDVRQSTIAWTPGIGFYRTDTEDGEVTPITMSVGEWDRNFPDNTIHPSAAFTLGMARDIEIHWGSLSTHTTEDVFWSLLNTFSGISSVDPTLFARLGFLHWLRPNLALDIDTHDEIARYTCGVLGAHAVEGHWHTDLLMRLSAGAGEEVKAEVDSASHESDLFYDLNKRHVNDFSYVATAAMEDVFPKQSGSAYFGSLKRLNRVFDIIPESELNGVFLGFVEILERRGNVNPEDQW